MKKHFYLVCVLIAACANVGASDALVVRGAAVTPFIPKDMTARVDARRGRGLPETECLSFFSNSLKREAGFMCLTSSLKLVDDYGFQSITLGEKGIITPEVATGLSLYPMERFSVSSLDAYAADVDCDDGDGPQYRATSTCNVAIARLGSGRYLFSNFLIRDDVKRIELARKADVESVWKCASYRIEPSSNEIEK